MVNNLFESEAGNDVTANDVHYWKKLNNFFLIETSDLNYTTYGFNKKKPHVTHLLYFKPNFLVVLFLRSVTLVDHYDLGI